MQSLIPDKTVVGTAVSLGKQLGFEFKGPGWYLFKNGRAILVLPNERNHHNPGHPMRKASLWPTIAEFAAHVYNSNPSDLFNAIANAPTRLDGRNSWEG